jgi:hypothetical protein
METTLTDAPPVVEKQLNPFERYLTVWVALCMVAGVVLGQVAPGLVHTLRTDGVRSRQPYQSADRRAHLADDRADDDEGRFRLDSSRRGASGWTRHYAVRQLGGQTNFYGVLRMAVLSRRICLVDHAG